MSNDMRNGETYWQRLRRERDVKQASSKDGNQSVPKKV